MKEKCPAETEPKQDIDIAEDLDALLIRYDSLGSKIAKVKTAIQVYREYCISQEVPDDAEGLQLVEELVNLVETRMQEILPIQLNELQNVVKYGQQVDHYRRMFRSLLHAAMTASTAMDWGAGSQKQSNVPMTFELSVKVDNIHYLRYGNRRLKYWKTKWRAC